MVLQLDKEDSLLVLPGITGQYQLRRALRCHDASGAFYLVDGKAMEEVTWWKNTVQKLS
jgi:hypothetical protein